MHFGASATIDSDFYRLTSSGTKKLLLARADKKLWKFLSRSNLGKLIKKIRPEEDKIYRKLLLWIPVLRLGPDTSTHICIIYRVAIVFLIDGARTTIILSVKFSGIHESIVHKRKGILSEWAFLASPEPKIYDCHFPNRRSSHPPPHIPSHYHKKSLILRQADDDDITTHNKFPSRAAIHCRMSNVYIDTEVSLVNLIKKKENFSSPTEAEFCELRAKVP